jgi:outer membrane receptor for ferrienterochelin and colicins
MTSSFVFTFLFTASLLFGHLTPALGQQTIQIQIRDSITSEGLPGAKVSLEGTKQGGVANSDGIATVKDVANGTHVFIASATGFEAKRLTLTVPLTETSPIQVLLTPKSVESEEILIEATRSNRSIDEIPTRVEVLTEEIDEAASMDPSKIAHLITHSTGIQVQQTSATSNTADVRIQGLPGRYTQMLKDGFPLYGGFSGSLSIMQIPPLDLRQVEYIKGSASTLYGGGAISGLINLLSKEPGDDETLLHINRSSVGALDLNAFYGRRFEEFGITMLASRNTHTAFDADDDGYADLPELTKVNFNPKFYYYPSDKVKLYLGGTFTSEFRTGGDMHLLNDATPDSIHFYRENNETSRFTTQARLDWKTGETSSFTVRNSFTFFDRVLERLSAPDTPRHVFAGDQSTSFSEITYSTGESPHVLIAGANLYTDRFKERLVTSTLPRDEEASTIGGFLQHTWDVGTMLSLETGFRGDYASDYGFFALPRISGLIRWSPKITTRLTSGLGYKLPSIFTEESEVIGYKHILPIAKGLLEAERSFGGNFDLNYKTVLSETSFLSINQMFFYTKLNDPLVLLPASTNNGTYQFQNANGYLESKGFETATKIGFFDFVLFIGYTYTDARQISNGVSSSVPLTPTHSLKGDLLYVMPGIWRIGVDYEFKSAQTLSSGRKTRALFTSGAVVERSFENITLFLNAENFGDVRQTRYESSLTPPHHTPEFTEVWAPLDGFVLNGGIKIRL